MPYQSKAQQGFLHAQHPQIAARWDRHTSKKQFRKLPQHVKKAAATGILGEKVEIPKEKQVSRRRIAELDRQHTFRARHHDDRTIGKQGHWNEGLKAHHQAKIDYHTKALARISQWDRPSKKKIKKRLPGETKPQAVQRHQRQAAGLITAGAAVPAILGLRSGVQASRALASGDKAAHALNSGMQLRHAATATALGGLAGATAAAPIPHRLLSINPKRNRKPKIKTTGVTKKVVVHARPGIAPDTVKHRHRKGAKPALDYDQSGVGKAWDRDKKQGAGMLAGGAAGIATGVNQNNIAAGYARGAHAVHGARLGRAQSQLAALKAAPSPAKASRLPGQTKGAARRVAIAPRTAGIKAAAGKVNNIKSSINAIPKVQRTVAEHSLVGGLAVGLPLAYAGAHKLASRNKVTKRKITGSDVDAATTGGIAGTAAYHGVGYGSKPLERKITANLNPAQKLTLASHKQAHGIGPNHPAGAKEWKPFFRSYPKSLPGAGLKRAMSITHGGKAGLATQAAVIGAGAAGAVHMRRKLAKGDDMSVDAWGVVRDDLEKAYTPGSITLHQTQADLHGRKKASGNRQIGQGTSLAGLAGAGAIGAHRGAQSIGEAFAPKASAVGTAQRAIKVGRIATNVERGAKIGGAAGVGAGLGLAGAGLARRTFHGARQNTQTGLAQSARRQRNAGLSKALRPSVAAGAGFAAGAAAQQGAVTFGAARKKKTGTSPMAAPVAKFDRQPQQFFEAQRTVGGDAGFTFRDPGVGETNPNEGVVQSAISRAVSAGYAKNWDGYYAGSAPIKHQKAPGETTSAGAAAFGGALAGAGAPKAARKLKSAAPKFKAAGAVLRAK